MKPCIQVCLASGVFLCSLLVLNSSQAQVVTDGTLTNNSTITTDGNTNTITGGTQAGNNLFHSFEQFSIPTGDIAYFNNAPEIQNIFSRVTGSSASNIDGLIKANGAANLFLLNPNGLVFGSNAKLDIGGSFIGTTASSINFADGLHFSASPPQTAPLLTVSIPIGLGFGSSSGAIRVVGKGHDLTPANYQPLNRGNSSKAGLQVQPGKTLALVGGDIDLKGSVLTAQGGRIELGGVGQGLVRLNPSSSGWDLDYTGVTSFKDINLFQKALADASGTGSGSIQLQGRRLQLSDASLILIQNQSTFPTGTIKVNASESLLIRGFDSSRKLSSGIWSESLSSGNGGEILVSTPELKLQSSGQIFSATFGSADAGNISLSIPKSLQIIGYHHNEVEGGVIVSSVSLGTGQSGDITISTGQLNVTNGGVILTSSLSPLIPDTTLDGSGNININATNFVEVNGTAPDLYNNPSAISAATFSNASGGNVTINTNSLIVTNGGRVDSSTGASGSAGSVTIKASDLVEVSRVSPSSGERSLLISSANVPNKELQQFFKLPPEPSGESGNVNISTQNLRITDSGQVNVKNDGTGDAGKISLEADSIKLNNSGEITAASASGEGGNIFLRSQSLQLRNGSNITATAGGTGNGGNITVNTDTLAALPKDNSDISANAFMGNGGNIQITTQGLFGIAPRTLRTSLSDITASSDLGIDGVIDVKTLGFDVRNAIIPLQANFISPEQALAGSCLARRNAEQSSFVVAGSGGLPPDPYSRLEVWDTLTGGVLGQAQTIGVSQKLPNLDRQNRSDKKAILPLLEQPNSNQETLVVLRPSKWKVGDPIVETQGIITTPDGRSLLESIPQQRKIQSPESLVCGDS